MIFNIIVCALCLISSYYYGYLACGRYIEGTDNTYGKDEIITTTIFEVIFFIHMCVQFFREFKPSAEKPPVRDFAKCAMNYINTGFAKDFIPLLPFYAVKLKRNRQNLFYIIKMVRLIKGFEIFDVHTMME